MIGRRRWTLRNSVLTLSLLYISALCCLHGIIQLQSQQGATFDNSRRRSQYDNHTLNTSELLLTPGDTFETTTQTTRYSCPPVQHGRFREVLRSPRVLFIYSAFFDDRYEPNMYIRFVAAGSRERRGVQFNVLCQFLIDGGLVRVKTETYELCENHGKKYSSYILSCRLPKNVTTTPCNVTVVTYPSVRMFVVPVQYPQKNRYEFGVCVPPLYGSVMVVRLVEFIELNRILGANKFHFYVYRNQSSTQNFVKVLNYYRSQGIVTYDEWNLPDTIGSDIWYYGQSVSINDCHFRHIGQVDYLTFQDIDEFIVPQTTTTWKAMVSQFWKAGASAYKFKSVFVPPSSNDRNIKLVALERLSRTRMASSFRSKVIIKPEWVFEVGIHHVSRIIEGHSAREASNDMAVVFHYRECLKSYGMDCRSMQNDMSMLRYAQRLKTSFNATMCQLEECAFSWSPTFPQPSASGGTVL